MNLPKILQEYIFPHSQGERRAKLAHHPALGGYLGTLISLAIFFSVLPHLAPAVLGFSSNLSAKKIILLTNQEREKAGLNKLRFDDRLAKSAQAKGEDMLANSYWAHNSPQGKTPWQFILAQGYDYVYAGENLAKDFSSEEDAVSAWMASPAHKANIINPNYTSIGVAVVHGELAGEEAVLVVQMFGAESVIPNSLGATAEGKASTIANRQELSPATPANMPAINKFALGKDVSVVILAIVMSLLLIDSWYLRKQGIIRLSGHNFAHLLILATAFAGLLGSGAGSIL